MTAAEFVHALHGVRKSGEGFVAKCPGHDDKSPSLSVSDGDNGGVLLFCHAGCEVETILDRLGMKLSDLMPPKTETRELRRKIAEHWYRDEKGGVLYVRERYSSGQKITQRRPEGAGWVYNLDGVERTIYRRDKIAAADGSVVWWVEGEKCVEAMESIGCLATTSGGAESWNAAHARFLFGRDVVILPDNDEPGRKHAEAVLAGLTGKARSVRILDLPLEERGDDVAEWIAQGGSKEALLSLLAESDEGKIIQPEECARRFQAHIEAIGDGSVSAGLRSGISQLDALTGGFKPARMYVICGETSMGKSLVGVHAAMTMARSGKRVVFVSLEMPLVEMETRFVSYLTRLPFRDVEEVFASHDAVKVARVIEATKERRGLPISVLDGAGLPVKSLVETTRAYRRQYGADVLIVDYIQLLTDDSKRGMNREQEVTQISRACQRMAKKEKIPVVVMAQLRRRDVRNEDHRPSLERLRESGALEQDAHAVIGINWPHRFDPDAPWGEAEMVLLKNRSGQTGAFSVQVDWTCGRVS